MPTKAYGQFKKTLARSEILIEFYIQNVNTAEEPCPKDVIRGAVVLSVAVFDAYVTNVFTEKFIPFIKNNKVKENMIELLKKAGFTTAIALEMIEMDRPKRRIRTLIDNYYSKYTTQKFEVINNLLINYDLKDIIENAARKSKKTSLKRSVEKLIERRHMIAHSRDYNKNNKLKKIDERNVLKRIQN